MPGEGLVVLAQWAGQTVVAAAIDAPFQVAD